MQRGRAPRVSSSPSILLLAGHSSSNNRGSKHRTGYQRDGIGLRPALRVESTSTLRRHRHANQIQLDPRRAAALIPGEFRLGPSIAPCRAMAMNRDIFTEDHHLFREQVRRFVENEVAPKIPGWNASGSCDRDVWLRMGAEGFLGANAPALYGGAGADFLFDAIVVEELARARAHALMMSLHSGVCLPYLTSFGTEAQKRRYVPAAIRGEILLGIAMTEPATGSDLAAVQTTARRDGDHYVVNGSKMFISHGQAGDLFIVVAKTDPTAKPAHRGISLILVEGDSPGFVRGRQLDQLGLRGQDTSEIFFEDCRVPVANLLGGEEGRGLMMLSEKLLQA